MSKPKSIEAVVLQLSSAHPYQSNLDKLLALLATSQDNALIVVPEVFLTAYDYEHIEEASRFSAKALKILKEKVHDQILAVTLILRKNKEFVNQAVVIHKHKIVHRQNKTKLFKLGDEDRYLRAGKEKEIKPFEINGVRYALLICFELRFKALWKQIEGVDVVLVPARWGLPRKVHLEILSRALAVMNQCFVIVSNSSDADMASSSAIISPAGSVSQDDTKNFISATIDLDEIKKMRRYIVMD
jgi:predicted amidohydrolase